MINRNSFMIMILAVAAVMALTAFSSLAKQAASGEELSTDDAEIRDIFEEDMKEGVQEKILEFLDKTNPEKARSLRELRINDAAGFDREMAEIGRKMREKMDEMRKRHEPDAVTRATDKGDWNKKPQDIEPQEPREPRRPGPGMGRGEPRDSYLELMRKRNDEFAAWLKENYPASSNDFENAVASNPERAFRDLMPSLMKYRSIFETEKKNPKLAELMKKDLELQERNNEVLAQIKASADDKAKTKLTAELKAVVEARFDLILQKRQLKFEELRQRLIQLEKEIKKQETDLEELSKQRDEQVNKRVQELLSQEQKIEWDD